MTDFHPLRSLNEEDRLSEHWKSLNQQAEDRTDAIAESATMPNMDHTSMKEFYDVYEPSDDTYLLIDGIKEDLKKSLTSDKTSKDSSERLNDTTPNIVLEIGSGSGVPITYLTNSLVEKGFNVKPIATDINPKALELTRKTAEANNIENLETIQCDLASDLLESYRHQMDYIIFNPPYVPTPDEEVSNGGIEASWAGGERGRRVVDRAITQIVKLLKPNGKGIGYMITVDDNEPEEIANQFADLGCTMIPWVRRKAHNEYLSVQKITKNK